MKEVRLEDIGPLQLLAVSFTEPTFSGAVNNELQKLRDQKLVRIVDGVVVHKDASGKISALEQSDLSADENMEYGEVIGSLIGLGTGNIDIAIQSSTDVAEAFHQRYEYGLDKADIEDLAEQMPENTAVMWLLIEHRWLLPLRNAMREQGGALLSQDFLSPELLMSLGKAGAATNKAPLHAAA
jgi:uncharacterized membrane protein